jgi:GT2 family glycosyltransferase
MKIAFNILFCNKAEQTIETLENLLSFNVPINLLNNGSDKESTRILEKWVKNKPINYMKVKENGGVSKGRNYLIKNTKEDWLFFLDNDITIPQNDWLDILKTKMQTEPETLVFVPQIINVHLGSKKEKFYRFVINGEDATFEMFNKGRTNKISGGACIVHRSVFDTNGLYNEDFFVGFEDYEFSLRAMKSGTPLDCLCVPEIKLYHDHRKVVRNEDNKYLETRYNEDKIIHSYNLVYQLHNVKLPNSGYLWARGRREAMKVEPQEEKRKGVTRILLYANDQMKIGGIETFNKNFCKRMSKWYDITFVIKKGDFASLNEISKYAQVIFDEGQEFETDICIYAQTWGNRSTKIKAKRYIQMIHGDYEWLKESENFEYRLIREDAEHVACGKYAGEKFEEVTGHKAITIYNLLDPDKKPRKLLKLITVSRIARFKGFEKIPLFVEKLKANNIPFIWHIWGDGTMPEYEKKIREQLGRYQEVVFMGVTANATDYVADADYLVLLSESEAFPYSTYEALQVGTPCIVTNFPSATDQIRDAENGYIFKMDLSDLDVDKIYNKIPKFEFKELGGEQDWKSYLGGAKKVKPRKTQWDVVELEAVTRFRDLVIGRNRKVGERFYVDMLRAKSLLNNPQKIVRLANT